MVMQQLMEQSPLPMLLMRTVIQSLTMYPRLGGFVMNILSRLIMKQVTRPWLPQPFRQWAAAGHTEDRLEAGPWGFSSPLAAHPAEGGRMRRTHSRPASPFALP